MHLGAAELLCDLDLRHFVVEAKFDHPAIPGVKGPEDLRGKNPGFAATEFLVRAAKAVLKDSIGMVGFVASYRDRMPG
jgi:hypothetical protein